MFAKLKKKIDFENSRPVQNTHVQQSVLNQNISSSITQAPVHQSAKSQNPLKRLPHSRTSTSEEFNDDQLKDTTCQFSESSDKTPDSKSTIRSNSQDSKDKIPEFHKISDETISHVYHEQLIDDITKEIELYNDSLECPGLLDQFESEVIPSLNNNVNLTSPERRLLEAENRIKKLEAELQEKTLRLEQASRTEAHLSNQKNELATCKSKLAEVGNDRKHMVSDLKKKVQELSEIQQQFLISKKELEETTDDLKNTSDALNSKLTELTSSNLENEKLSLKLSSLSKVNKELVDRLEMMRRERADLIERHLHEISLYNTQVEVAEADRKMLEIKIVDLERKFENDLKITREGASSNFRKVQCEHEEQIKEKNKFLKKQEQTLIELRKVIQRELSGKQQQQQQMNSNMNNNSSLASLHNNSSLLADAEEAFFNNSSDVEVDSVARIHVTSNETHSLTEGGFDVSQDLNFKYLKHVILKFLLSREHEALQLIKVVSMLLRFSNEEEKMIKDTLQWRTSWFRSKPQLPEKGQTAIVVPALY